MALSITEAEYIADCEGAKDLSGANNGNESGDNNQPCHEDRQRRGIQPLPDSEIPQSKQAHRAPLPLPPTTGPEERPNLPLRRRFRVILPYLHLAIHLGMHAKPRMH